MAEEAGASDYVPVVYGEYVYERRKAPVGVWKLMLAHDLILTDGHNQVCGHVVPAGSTIYLEIGSFHTQVFVPAYDTAYPDDWDRADSPVAAAISARIDGEGWKRDYPQTLPELPF